MIYSIDRFEGEFVTCEDDAGNILTFNKSRFPDNARENDCFTISQTGEIILDDAETEKRKNIAYNLQQKLMGE